MIDGIVILILLCGLSAIWIGLHERLADIDAEEERRFYELEKRLRKK